MIEFDNDTVQTHTNNIVTDSSSKVCHRIESEIVVGIVCTV